MKNSDYDLCWKKSDYKSCHCIKKSDFESCYCIQKNMTVHHIIVWKIWLWIMLLYKNYDYESYYYMKKLDY